MDCCLDTGALVKLYVAEPGSDAVQNAVGDSNQLGLNPLQCLEARNALFAAVGRGILSEAALCGRIGLDVVFIHN